MTRMTGPDCAVMCTLINTHTHMHTQAHAHTQRRRSGRERSGNGNGAGTETGTTWLETRGRTQDVNDDRSGDGNESSGGDGKRNEGGDGNGTGTGYRRRSTKNCTNVVRRVGNEGDLGKRKKKRRK